jgi:hypothetical protein
MIAVAAMTVSRRTAILTGKFFAEVENYFLSIKR